MPEIHFEEQESPDALRVPRGLLLGAALLMALVAGLALLARTTDAGALRVATAAPAEVVAMRELRFADRADGGVVVSDARTGETVHALAPGQTTFIRGAMRGLAFERRKRGIGAEVPFRLTRWRGGRLTLEDPATGSLLDLAAYGADNARAFAILLPLPT